jgi:hypothetical protein
MTKRLSVDISGQDGRSLTHFSKPDGSDHFILRNS